VMQVPVSVCRERGAEFIIAVNVIPNPVDTPLGKNRNGQSSGKAPSLVEVLIQSFTITGYRIAMEDMRLANLMVHPQVESVGFWQFDQAKEAIAAGEAAARSAILKDRSILSYLTAPSLKID
jgi:predicted acylesterase/phospholipase RssA